MHTYSISTNRRQNRYNQYNIMDEIITINSKDPTTMNSASNLAFVNPIQALTKDKSQFLSLIYSGNDPSAKPVKDFIRSEFLEHYDARINEFMPNLVSIINKTKQVRAVVGYRSAENNKLFLEQYLDHPIDTYISEHCGMPIPRSQIVEVGNLACSANGYARLVIIRLTEMLYQSGYRWVVFTATQRLYNSFLRLGLVPNKIAPADISRLENTKDDWGSYYDNDPYVMFGSIKWGFNKLKQERFI